MAAAAALFSEPRADRRSRYDAAASLAAAPSFKGRRASSVHCAAASWASICAVMHLSIPLQLDLTVYSKAARNDDIIKTRTSDFSCFSVSPFSNAMLLHTPCI